MNAPKVSIKVTRPEVVVPPPTFSITLNLDQREAEAFLVLTRRIGGAPDLSFRGVTDKIGDALHAAGVPTDDSDKWLTSAPANIIQFKSYAEAKNFQ